jgi:hypothetical protein
MPDNGFSGSALAPGKGSSAVVQPAVPEMAPIASRLIHATMGIVADHLFGAGESGQSPALVGSLFRLRHNVFSY